MISYFGDFAEDDTVLIPFNTFDSNDPSASVTVTTLIASDIYVHKDGSVTDIVTDGATIAIDFDGITGNHLITIDTSAHADYSTGSEYAVRIEGATVDAGNINAWVGAFSIERAGGALAVAKLIQTAVITNAAGADVAADIIAVKAETANIVADTNELQTDDVPGLIATLDAVVDTVKAETALIVADTNELQTDWADGGRLDLIQDIIAADTTTDIPALIATAQADLDTLTGSDGATLATAQGNYAPAVAGDSMDVLSISGSTSAADKLEANLLTTKSGACTATTLGNAAFSTNLTEVTDDHYKGRIVIFTSGVLIDQATDITGYTGSTKVLAVSQMTEAPSDTDTFIII